MKPTDSTLPLLMTQREAVRHLRVTERTVFNLIRRGLPVVKFGTSVRIDRADLVAFIQKQREVRNGQ